MFRRLPILAACTLGLLLAATPSSAQDASTMPATLAVAQVAAFAGTSSPLFSAEQIQRALPPPPVYRVGRPSTLLTSLYASTALMQALDVHSTLSAFRAGAREANPLMDGVTKNRAAFLAVKAGVAASTILATRQLSKRNKTAAIVTLVAVNSAYAFVVNHNYRVARGVK